MMRVEVYDAAARLVCFPAFVWPSELPRQERRAEMERRMALRQHIFDVAKQVQTVDELAAALKVDGTLAALG